MFFCFFLFVRVCVCTNKQTNNTIMRQAGSRKKALPKAASKAEKASSTSSALKKIKGRERLEIITFRSNSHPDCLLNPKTLKSLGISSSSYSYSSIRIDILENKKKKSTEEQGQNLFKVQTSFLAKSNFSSSPQVQANRKIEPFLLFISEINSFI